MRTSSATWRRGCRRWPHGWNPRKRRRRWPRGRPRRRRPRRASSEGLPSPVWRRGGRPLRPQLDLPERPRPAATALTQAMKGTTNVFALAPLAQGLSAVAARMEPNQAAATLTQAVAVLLEAAMTKHLDAGDVGKRNVTRSLADLLAGGPPGTQ